MHRAAPKIHHPVNIHESMAPMGDRTIAMAGKMAQYGWDFKNDKDTIKVQLPSPYGEHVVMNRSVKNFRQKLASVGASLSDPNEVIKKNIGREIILLDPAQLEPYYQELKLKIASERDPERVMNLVVQFVREQFKSSSLSDIEKYVANAKHKKYQDQPIVYLHQFIKEIAAGVCRHHGALSSFLYGRLMEDGILPPGRIYHHRDDINGGAHVWVMVKLYRKGTEKTDRLYVSDSLWNAKVFQVQGDPAKHPRLTCYGNEAAARCAERYVVPYSELSVAEKDAFINDVLDEKELPRRKRLNLHHADIALIIKDLNASKYQTKANHKDVSDDAVRVTTTDQLHAIAYSQNKSHGNERQQFMIALLLKPASKRKAILEKQSDIDLECMTKSLELEDPTRGMFYKGFANYKALLKEVADMRAHKQNQGIANVIVPKKLAIAPVISKNDALIRQLLDAKPLDRKKILNEHASELVAIKSEFETNYSGKGISNYVMVLADIAIVMSTNTLLASPFTSYCTAAKGAVDANGASRQQYLLALLVMEDSKREAFLAKQQIKDLDAMVAELTSADMGSKDYYQSFLYYNTLLLEIYNAKQSRKGPLSSSSPRDEKDVPCYVVLIDEPESPRPAAALPKSVPINSGNSLDNLRALLNYIKDTIESGIFIPRRRHQISALLCCFFTPGTAIYVRNNKKLYVPERVSLMHALIPSDLSVLSERRLKDIFASIRGYAQAALNDPIERDGDTARLYSRLAKIAETTTYADIIADLHTALLGNGPVIRKSQLGPLA